MTKQEILDMLNKNQTVYLATADGDTPHVRGMMMYRAEEKGIVFHTGANKDLARQLEANPKAEICCFDSQTNVQVRISGIARLLFDMDLKKEIVGKQPFMKPWIDKLGYDALAVFRLEGCKAVVWTMETNFAPKEYIEL